MDNMLRCKVPSYHGYSSLFHAIFISFLWVFCFLFVFLFGVCARARARVCVCTKCVLTGKMGGRGAGDVAVLE